MTTLSSLAIRLEAHADTAAVRTILRAAFARDAEADLVERVRAGGDFVLALVAQYKGEGLVGYVAFPGIALQADGLRERAVALGPLAVKPDYQKRGIGSALVCEGIAALAAQGERLVFVLGDPAYYARFGFRADTAAPFHSRYAGSHFMALRLASGGPATGRVDYPAAFDQLG